MADVQRYWAGTLLAEAVNGHRGWRSIFGSPKLQTAYDCIIIGGGGHGLATAYYLASEHNKRVAVLEKGWVGGGNTGRNTTVIRSNYLYPESADFYDFSLTLYERLSQQLNYNIMLSQRGVLTLAHSPHDWEMLHYWAGAMRRNGVDSDLLSASDVARRAPLLNCGVGARFPVAGGLIQPRGGVARHDAVAWGYARAAADSGVHIVQGCEVRAFDIVNGAVRGVETTRGRIRCEQAAIVAAGASAQLARLAGVSLPMQVYTLQAFVSEPVKPVLDVVALSLATGAYLSQSDKGELVMGGGLDLYPSFSQRGAHHVMESVLGALVDMYPRLGAMRLLRSWGGAVDVAPDSSPLMGRTPVAGLYINCGWGTGGFKAIPAGGFCLAHTMAHEAPHPLIAGFGLDRFACGALIDEAAAAGIAH